jgi:nicotinamide mononucleotide transporter
MLEIFGYQTSYLELFGTLFSFVAIVLASRNKIWNWPIGIIGQFFFFILFLKNHLFGQVVLQVFFTVVSIYGWTYWGKDIGKKIKILSKKTFTLFGVLIITLCLLGGYVLSFFQPEYALLDASVTIMSIFAVIFLSKKYLNGWYLWILLDILSVWLFYSKGIYILAIEYVVITCVATYGLIHWLKLYKEQ